MAADSFFGHEEKDLNLHKNKHAERKISIMTFIDAKPELKF